jgi:hypothetical protein
MLYPDGTSVKEGDLIWWDEGNCVGFVNEVIETEADQRKWGLRHPHISIGGHPFRPGAPGFVTCPASLLADEGIGRLTADDCVQLNRAIEHAQAQAGVDLSIVDFVVQTEVCDGVQTAWLIRIKPAGEENGTIRVSVDLVDGA